jgi:hypothetical protein
MLRAIYTVCCSFGGGTFARVIYQVMHYDVPDFALELGGVFDAILF